jgi:hypothetical protein
MSLRDVFFERIMSIRRAQRAAAARKSAITAAPAAPLPPADYSSSAQAQPAQPTEPKSAQIVDLRKAALAAGYYIAPGRGGAQSIANEFPPDPVRENWLRTSNQAQPKYEPDTTDISGDGIARAFEAQQRRLAKEQSS